MALLELFSREESKSFIDELREHNPGVPVVSFSQIMSYDRCEFAWNLSYNEGWKARDEGPALLLGTMIHELLAVWYHTRSREQVQAAIYEQMAKYGTSSRVLPLLAEASWLVMRFVDDWAGYMDADLEVIAIEEHFVAQMVSPKGNPYYLQGYTDLRAKIRDWMVLIDWKSSTKFMSPIESMMDPQLPFYAGAYRQNGIPVTTTIHRLFNTYEYKDKSNVSPEKLFREETNHLSDVQLDNTMWEVGLAVDAMLETQQWIEFNKGTHPRRRLRRDCNRCKYQMPCFEGLRGIDIYTVLPVDFTQGSEEEESNDSEELDIYL